MIRFRKAVLIIHGFAGGVYDQEYLSTRLEINRKLDVYTFTLPGHAGDKEKKVTYKDWIKKSEEITEFLIKNGYREIYLIGHSMGGVIATYIASKYREVKKLVLAAPAFEITGHMEDKWNIGDILKGVPKIIEQYGFKVVKDRMTKVPVNYYGEFLKLTKKYGNVSKKITIPTLLIWGREDNIVPLESSKNLINNLATTKLKSLIINDSTHDIFCEPGKVEVTKYIENFFMKTNFLYKIPDEIREKVKNSKK